MASEMKLVETSGQIDLTTWFKGKAKSKEITEMIKEAFDKEPPILYFPLQYEPTDDPVMIRVDLPLDRGWSPGDRYGETVSFEYSLEALVDDIIDWYIDFTTDSVNDEMGRENCSAIVKRLRELADKLEGAMKEGNT